MGKTITIENVRISYPNLFTAKRIADQGEPKYSAAFLIEETNPKLKELSDIASALTKEANPKGIPANFKPLPIHKGSEKYPGNSQYEGYWILNASNRNRPTVVDQQMERVIDPDKVYPGMVVNVALSVYTYNNVSKGVSVGLEAVQLVKDGERLDSRPDVDDLFKPIEVEEGTAFNPLA